MIIDYKVDSQILSRRSRNLIVVEPNENFYILL